MSLFCLETLVPFFFLISKLFFFVESRPTFSEKPFVFVMEIVTFFQQKKTLFFTLYLKDNVSKISLGTQLLRKAKKNILSKTPTKFGKIVMHTTFKSMLANLLKKSWKFYVY